MDIVEIVVFAIILITALAGVVILVALFYFLSPKYQRQQPWSTKTAKTTTRPAVSQDLERQLLGMVAGDSSLATRLVNSVRDRNPRQSETWCWEKAIDDLVRDRR
jgi:cytochrome c-type biogenesis protein CcmH/NrfG